MTRSVTILSAVALGSIVALALLGGTCRAAPEPLPYDQHNPVIYDNDGAIESGFTDVYVMALASAGVIGLKGIITTGSYGEAQRHPPFAPAPEEKFVQERQELIEKARRSGLRNLPDATAGCSLSLKRPASGRIEDTPTYGSPGSRLILQEARKASPGRPLVVLMGGQATSVVDAYLLDPSIAERMVLAWIVGNKTSAGGIDSGEYNAAVDPWATYIAFEKLRVVAFPFTNDGNDANDGFAATPKTRLGELPDTELRQTMQEARWPRSATTFSEPNADLDAMPVFPLTRPDYVQVTKRVTFSKWYPVSWRHGAPEQVPAFKEDPQGRVMAVWSASPAVATDEWWRRMKDPAAWRRPASRVPFRAAPATVPGTIEMEQFDHGGEGRAYHDLTNNFSKAGWLNPIRFLEQVDILASPNASGGYCVSRAEVGEWIDYSVKVARSGAFTLITAVASDGPGGIFHVEFDGTDRTGPLAVPDTGGGDTWHTLSRPGIALSAGVHVMRFAVDAAGPAGGAGNFDYVSLDPPDRTP